MYKHLLIATDGSQASAKALAHGLALAKSLAAQVTVVTVTEPWTEGTYAAVPTPSMIQVYEKAAAGNAATILEGVKRAADEAEPLPVEQMRPPSGLPGASSFRIHRCPTKDELAHTRMTVRAHHEEIRIVAPPVTSPGI